VQVGRAQDAVGVVAEEAETVEEGDSLRASGHGLVALRTDIGHHATVEQAVGDVAAQMAETSNQIVVRCALGADIVLRAGDTVGEVAGVAQEARVADHDGAHDALGAYVLGGTGLAVVVGARSALTDQVGLVA
jgi:hypothetical protein